MAIIKYNPEDFIVKEINDIPETNEREGNYEIFILMKRNMTTIEAIQAVSKATGISLDEIKSAGNKDKRAITLQLITIPKISAGNPKNIESLNLKDISLKHLGYSKDPLAIGKLKGNEFEITVREIEKFPKVSKEIIFANYFGEQRFSRNNIQIGKYILKGDYDNAIKDILSYSFDKKDISQINDWSKIDTTKADKISKIIIRHLINNPNDKVGAIRKIPINIALLYIHSFQSWIFNKVLSDVIDESFDNKFEIKIIEKIWTTTQKKRHAQELKIPLPGFATNLLNYQLFNVNEKMIILLEKEGIRLRDFVVRSYPLLSESGSDRYGFAKAQISMKRIDGKTMKIKFRLPSGSYATTLLKTLFGENGEEIKSYDPTGI